MKYFLIAGEASGDLHASNLMAALKNEDAQAEFRFFGGDLMQAVGGTLLKHYREMAFMGIIPENLRKGNRAVPPGCRHPGRLSGIQPEDSPLRQDEAPTARLLLYFA